MGEVREADKSCAYHTSTDADVQAAIAATANPPDPLAMPTPAELKRRAEFAERVRMERVYGQSAEIARIRELDALRQISVTPERRRIERDLYAALYAAELGNIENDPDSINDEDSETAAAEDAFDRMMRCEDDGSFDPMDDPDVVTVINSVGGVVVSVRHLIPD